MKVLLQLALSWGISQIGDALSEKLKSGKLSNAELEALASKITQAAITRGQNAISRAAQAINNIPYLAGSPKVQSYLNAARRKASDNLRNVEDTVAKAQEEAAGISAELQHASTQGIASKAMDMLKRENPNDDLASRGAKFLKETLVENNVGGIHV